MSVEQEGERSICDVCLHSVALQERCSNCDASIWEQRRASPEIVYQTDEADGSRCPVCGLLDTDAWEYFRESNGDANIECPRCSTPLTICMEVSYNYRSWVRK